MQIIQQFMTRQCRCHGVSGSCTVKSCWNTVPDFLVVGDYLKRKYIQSVEVLNRPTKRRLRRKERSMRKVPITMEELVHLERSPNYCVRDLSKGIMGTSGRECNRTSSGGDSCDLLCCGRGYNTQEVRLVERCDCKFIWCCEVKCRACETVTDVFTCKWELMFYQNASEDHAQRRNCKHPCCSDNWDLTNYLLQDHAATSIRVRPCPKRQQMTETFSVWRRFTTRSAIHMVVCGTTLNQNNY